MDPESLGVLPWLTTSFVFGYLLVQMFNQWNMKVRWTDHNFRGKTVPTSVGSAFAATAAIVFPQMIFWSYLRGGTEASRTLTIDVRLPLLFVSSLIVFTSLGLLDDRLGSHEISGLRGHFRALFQGKVTTGAIKAIGGAVTAVIVAVAAHYFLGPERPPLHIVVDAPLIALWSNAINLLDRRPSRALKGYALSLLIIAAIGTREHLWFMIPVSAAALVYAPLDFRCRAMMGDAGSNALGATVGILAACDVPLAWKLPLVVGLFAFNLLSERLSYTKWIDSVVLLRWLDRLGVPSSLGGPEDRN